MGALESVEQHRHDADAASQEASMTLAERELHFAVITNDPVALQQAIDGGVDVNCAWRDANFCVSKNGLTPLFQAVALNYVRIAEMLLNAGASVTLRNRDFETVLHKAAFLGRARMIALLLQGGADVDCLNLRQETPLHLVCKQSCVHSSVESVLALLRHGADPNARNVNGKTPLHFAGNRGQQLLVNALLRNAANADAVESTLRTCFYSCVDVVVHPPFLSLSMISEYYNRQLGCLKVFIRYGCDTVGFAEWLYLKGPSLWRNDKELRRWMRTAVPESLKHKCRAKVQSMLGFHCVRMVDYVRAVGSLNIPRSLKSYLCRRIFYAK